MCAVAGTLTVIERAVFRDTDLKPTGRIDGEVAVAASMRKAAGGRAPVPMVEEAVVAAQVCRGGDGGPCPTAQMGRLPGGPATTTPAVAVVEEISSRWAVRGRWARVWVKARYCLFLGVIDLAGAMGQKPLNSDGGGGGGAQEGIST